LVITSLNPDGELVEWKSRYNQDMETRQALETAMREAMRSRDEITLRTIRMVMSSVKMAEIDKGQPVDEAGIQSILQKEIKSRQEAVAEAEKAGRSDLIEANKAEISILDAYVPKQMSASELDELVKTTVIETAASGPSDMGKVMKAILPKVQGRAPGNVVSAAVRKILEG
jgi:uncharacterized protein